MPPSERNPPHEILADHRPRLHRLGPHPGCDNTAADASPTPSPNPRTANRASRKASSTVELSAIPPPATNGPRPDRPRLPPSRRSSLPDSSAIGSGGTYAFRFETLSPASPPLACLPPGHGNQSSGGFSIEHPERPGPRRSRPSRRRRLVAGTSWRLAAWSASSLDPADFTLTAAFADGQISGRSAVISWWPLSASAGGASPSATHHDPDGQR